MLYEAEQIAGGKKKLLYKLVRNLQMHCQNVYDIAGSFSHALYSRMVDQTKKMASVVGSFEGMFYLR